MALLFGALYPLGFAPLSLFPLTILSLALFFLLMLKLSAKQALWRGWLFGLGSFGVGVSWVFVSIYNFGGVDVVTGVLITLLFVAFFALFPALLGYLLIRVMGGYQRSWLLLLVFPAGWVLTEWARSWILTGFPWLLLGYSQVDSPLAGFAPLLGGLGVSLLAAISAGLVGLLLLQGKGFNKKYLVMLLVIWSSGLLLQLVSWSKPVGESLDVTLVQGNIPQEIKWLPKQRVPTLELYGRLTQENWDSDLIVWPETAVPMYYHQAVSYFEQLSEEAKKNNSTLVLGVPVMDLESRDYFNSMISLGEQQTFYHKRHLVPFGEYLPLPALLGWVVDILKIPMADFAVGKWQQAPLEVAGQKMAVAICYEIAFGREMIDWFPEATLLLHASNNAWFGNSLAPHQHLEIARMRAKELARPILSVSNDGISALIDHRGRITESMPQYQTGVVNGKVQATTGTTPYMYGGDIPAILLSLFMIAAAWRQSRKLN